MISYQTYEHFRLRASSKTVLCFPGMNRYELWMLVQLDSYLKSVKREIVSKKKFFDSITGNGKRWKLMQGYYFGLVSKGYCGCYEYVNKPGSECVGISDLGRSVLAVYDIELKKIIKSHKATRNNGKTAGKYIPRAQIRVAA